MKVSKTLLWLAVPVLTAALVALLLSQATTVVAQSKNRVNAVLRDAPLEEALDVIWNGESRQVTVNPTVAKNARPVRLTLRNAAPEDAVRAVVKAAGAEASIEGAVVTVGPEEELDLSAPRLETRVFGQTKFLPNANAALRIVTLNHETGAPVSNADVVIVLSKPAKTGIAGFAEAVFRGRTNETGSLNASFKMPALDKGSYTMTVASFGLGERDRVVRNFSVEPAAQILLTTDKPVYQPSQTIHIRALALARPNNNPVANAEATLQVFDSKGNKVFKSVQPTSPYGIVSADFVLATELNMGTYKINASVAGAQQEKTVTVDRYVLPKFKVEFQPERSWYLPGETISGTVNAHYFFGKPVAGQVRIAFSTFDAGFNQFAEVTGRLDNTGHFKFNQKLPTFFAGLPLEQGNAFVKCEITVTDTADHEENATKSVPVAKSGLKVTIIPESQNAVPGADNRFYILTSYPDGTPAQTTSKVTLWGTGGRSTVREPIRTDAGGLAVLAFKIADTSTSVDVSARDDRGGIGTSSLNLQKTDATGVLLRTDKSLYKVSESAYLVAYSPQGRATMYFDVLRDRQTVLTKSVDLKNGRADMNLALTPDLSGTLEIHAYRIGRDGEIRRDTRVIYVDPANDLKVAVAPDKDTYLPGSQAKVRFTVTGPDGRPRPSALGISIVDESVFALQEMQPGMEKAYFLLEKEILEPRYEIHGFSPQDIVRPMPLTRDAPRQRAAGALFAALPRRDQNVTQLANTWQEKSMALQSRAWVAVAKDAEAIRLAVNKYMERRGEMPAVGEDLATRLVTQGYLTHANSRDPWKMPYRVRAYGETYRQGWYVQSPGPDRQWNTGDDISVWVWPTNKVNTDFFRGEGIRLRRGGIAIDGIEARQLGVVGGFADDRPVPTAVPLVTKEKSAGVDRLDAAAEPASGPAPAQVREYFPETLLFQPNLVTDNNGVASLEFPMADSITTWRMTAMASARNGALGSVTAPLRAFQDFFVDINFPVRLTQGDEVSVPVSVYNYLNVPQTVTLNAEKEDWFTLTGDAKQTVQLGANEVKGVRFRIKATGLGFRKLTVRAQGTSRADAVRREVEIVPNGKRFEQAFNGRLTGNVQQTVTIPESAIKDASNILVKIYPGFFSTVVEGMDKILRMPFGCFEQTSSVTYPNLLVLDYMKRTQRTTPEIQMKAEQYVNVGYQRLLSYEVDGGGFSWFGSAPANKVLTAYGLQEFADMLAVWDVDESMIQRTRDWEARNQNADGSWSPDKNYIDEGLGPMWKNNLLSTAYITWGMAESGKAVKGDMSAVDKAVNYIRIHASEARDNYALAILANAMVSAAPDDPTTASVIDRLIEQRTDEDGKTFWNTEQATMTFCRGDYSNVETTALAAYALIRSGRQPNVATRALEWLISKRDPSGTWGTTQATILTLKAMVASMGAQTQRGEATVTVMVNGNEAGTARITPQNADVLQQIDAKSFVKPGANDVQLILTGTGTMMYGISAYHYIPWEVICEPKNPMEITVKYDRERLQKDEALTCDVTVAYVPGNISPVPVTVTAVDRIGILPAPKTANMVVVDLGIPPGFSVEQGDLANLVDRKVITRFETTGRQVILYFDKIEAGKPVAMKIRMKAQFPLKARTPESVVYQYYEPDRRTVAAPVDLEVVG